MGRDIGLRAWTSVALSVAVVASLLVVPAPAAQAIVNGEQVTAAPSWMVWVKTPQIRGCSGALVAPQWVLTAAHCVAQLDPNDNDYSVVRAEQVRVEIGRTDGRGRTTSERVVAIETRRYRKVGKYSDDDVALLRLAKPVNARPLWILPSPSLAVDGTPLTLHGYGRTDLDDPRSIGTLHRTRGLDHTLWNCEPADGVACVDMPEGGSQAAPVDSGGPWTMDVDGQPILTLVMSSTHNRLEAPGQAASGETVYNELTLDWLASYLGLPRPPVGSIVRATSGASWLVDDDGFRRHIPDGGTYECLEARGARVFNLPTESLELMASRAVYATCEHQGGDGSVLLYRFDEGGFGIDGDATAVAGVLEAAGFDTTIVDHLPADLSLFTQVWTFTTYTAPSGDIADQLASYVEAGGALYINSEHACCYGANQAVQTLVNRMLAGPNIEVVTGCAGTCSSAEPYVFESAALGGIGLQPNQTPTLYTDAAGWYEGVSGANVLMRSGSGQVTGAVYADADLVGGSGRLVMIADSNWTDLARLSTFGNEPAVENIAAFLGS